MRFINLALLVTGFLAPFVTSQVQESDGATGGDEPVSTGDDTGSSGPAANTDVSKYAGTYNITYHFNNTGGTTPTSQLPCTTSESFLITFPSDPTANVITRNMSTTSDGYDPVYHTKQGMWSVAELAHGNGFDTLKLRIFQDDTTEIYACWALNLDNKRLIVNVNPQNYTQCPTSFVPVTNTCTPIRATLIGECTSGVCNGEKSPHSADESSDAISFSSSLITTTTTLLLFFSYLLSP